MVSMFERSFMLVVMLVSCSCISAGFLKSLKHKNIFNKRHNSAALKRSSNISEVDSAIFFKKLNAIEENDDIVLMCDVGGSPNPTINWLKDGKPFAEVQAGAEHEDTIGKDGLPLLRIANTNSRLTLGCVTPADNGLYTCVAETVYSKISKSIEVISGERSLSSIEECFTKKALTGEPAKITVWTGMRLEYQNNNIQLYCRATGNPKPVIQWYDVLGKPIEDGSHYRVTYNGDLIIKNVNWSDMGLYTCRAVNAAGSDRTETFVYPTYREKD